LIPSARNPAALPIQDEAEPSDKIPQPDKAKKPVKDKKPDVKPPDIKVQPPEFDPFAAQPLSSQTGESMTGFSPQMLGDGGYLDSAIPMTTFRLRYDAANGMNRPDRAEYMYGAWQELSYHPHGVVSNGVVTKYFSTPTRAARCRRGILSTTRKRRLTSNTPSIAACRFLSISLIDSSASTPRLKAATREEKTGT